MFNKVLIADDHTLIRNGLRQIIQDISNHTTIIETCNGEQTIEALNNNHDLDLIIFDLAMPDTDGMKTLRSLSDHPASVPVMVISASDSVLDLQGALDCGALGYIHKSENGAIMSAAIRLVMSGGTYVSPHFFRHTEEHDSNSLFNSLTRRQREVLCLILKGFKNKEIANKLGLSEITVKTHVGRILKHLGVDSRTKVVIMAKECHYFE